MLFFFLKGIGYGHSAGSGDGDVADPNDDVKRNGGAAAGKIEREANHYS